jgi:CheY-like chemotaxis protein
MKRVLFVDDDTALLDGLRARLHALRSQWEMVFVENGPRAVAELEQRPVDVIVADVRMPTMDGVELLEIVRDRWPHTIRIVLSGCAEEGQSGRLLSVVHQYISKPCKVDQLESAIGRCMQLRDVLNQPPLQALVGRTAHLPAMPRTCTSLRTAMADPDVSAREVARIIHEDSAVAAKVLQLVNSAFFRLARRITSIEQAVSYRARIARRAQAGTDPSDAGPDAYAPSARAFEPLHEWPEGRSAKVYTDRGDPWQRDLADLAERIRAAAG